jgi:hypothetical protein
MRKFRPEPGSGLFRPRQTFPKDRTCDGFPCLLNAKADAQTCCVEPALTHPNVTLLTEAKVTRLQTDGIGKKVTTGMRAGTGPGVEFLEYLAPRDGRRRPDDSKPNDILYWNTVLVTSDVECLVSELRAEHTHFLSAKVVVLSKGKKDSGKAVLVADPDGHGVLLIETAGAN